MISGIGSSTSYYSSLFATNGTSGSSATGSSSSLSQTEEKLFAAIDTNIPPLRRRDHPPHFAPEVLSHGYP